MGELDLSVSFEPFFKIAFFLSSSPWMDLIGADFKDVKRYKEFEISPQGEWIDLDVDLHKPHHEEGWTWNSGFKVSARIDRMAHIWYGVMRIAYSAIDPRPATPGNLLRVNLFR